MCGSRFIKSLVQAAAGLFVTAVAYKRSFIQPGTVIAAWDEISTMGITVVTKPAHFVTDRSIGLTDVFLFTVFKESTLITGFIEMVMLMEREVLSNFF